MWFNFLYIPVLSACKTPLAVGDGGSECDGESVNFGDSGNLIGNTGIDSNMMTFVCSRALDFAEFSIKSLISGKGLRGLPISGELGGITRFGSNNASERHWEEII